MQNDQVIEQFQDDIVARASLPAPGSQAAPMDGHRIKAGIRGLDGVVRRLKPILLAASPDEYDALLELATRALHSLAGGGPGAAVVGPAGEA